ncbi:MAG: hypothetical protein LIO75_01100, partial [Lachnospiraceae bacterium]|nr:hypothetical protein [Lachnospiraceae bacterium]
MTKLKSKRLLSLLLSLAMVFSLTAAPVFAADTNTSGGTTAASTTDETADSGNEEESDGTATENYVATVTDSSSTVTSYTTLAAAAEYASGLASGGTTCTITLLSNITLTEKVTLYNTNSAASKKLTLDLGGYTVTSNVENGYGLYLGSSGTNGLVIVTNGTINATADAYGAIEIDNEAVQLSSLTLTSRTSGHGTVLVDSVYGSSARFTDITITTTDGYCLEVAESGSGNPLTLYSGTMKFTQTASEGASSDQLNACVYLGGCSMKVAFSSSVTGDLSSDGYGVYIKGNSYFTGSYKGTVSGKTKAVYIDSSYSYSETAFTVSSSSTAQYNGGVLSDADSSTYSNGAVSISGGTYDEDLDDSYVASGYVCEYDESTSRYVINEDVIAILYDADGEQAGSYNSLSAAVKAAAKTSGYTVQLQKDYATTSSISITYSTYGSSDITIDLNGYTYTYTGTSQYAVSVNDRSGKFTITDSSEDGGGRIVSESTTDVSAAIVFYQGTLNVTGTAEIYGPYSGIQMGGTSSAYSSSVICELNVKDDAVVSGGTVGIAIYGSTNSSTDDSYGPVLTVSGGTVAGGTYGISGNGSASYYGSTTINITGGTVTGDATGIFHPQVGTLNVSGGEISGSNTGIEIRAGELNVTGGTISASSETFLTDNQGSGTTVVGAGIAVSQHSTDKAVTVNITGGEIYGYYGVYEINFYAGTNTSSVTVNVSDSDEEDADSPYIEGTGGAAVYSESISGSTTDAGSITTVSLTGGSYSSDVSEYCEDGCAAAVTAYDEEGNSVYTIVNGAAAVYDADGDYAGTYDSLSSAYTAVKKYSGGTICLLSDISGEKIKITSGTSVSFTLDLNGHAFDSGSSVAVLVQSDDASVTIDDSSEDGTGKIVSSNTTAAVYTTAGTIAINGGTIDTGEITTYVIRCGGGSIEVNDGTFSGYYIFRADAGSVTVNGGTFTSGTDGTSGNIVYDVGDDAALTINGGWFNADAAFRTSGDTIIVNGGYFTKTDTNLSRLKIYIPANYAVIEETVDETTWYTVGKAGFTVEYYDEESGETVIRSSHTTLSAAISAAQSGDTVVMNVDSDSGFKLNNSEMSITLDLNGCTISESDANSYVVGVVSGSLTIVDSSTEGTGTISGTLSSESTSSITGIVRNMGGTLTIESGTISIDSGNAVNAYSGTTTVTGGCINGSVTTNSTLSISGGYFSEDPSAYTADGYSAYDYDDDTYKYEVAVTRIAQIGDTYYYSLEDAVAAAQSGDAITVLADNTLTGNITISTEITLVLGDYVVTTGGYTFYIADGADVTITANDGGGVVNETAATGKSSISALKVVFYVYEGGELTISGGTYKTVSVQLLTVCGTATVENADLISTMAHSQSDSAAGLSSMSMIYVSGSSATLNFVSGYLNAGKIESDYVDLYGIYVAGGAIIILGSSDDNSGPVIDSVNAAIGMNNTASPATITIYGGTYTVYKGTTYSSQEKYVAVLYLAGDCEVNIYGGTFKNACADSGYAAYTTSYNQVITIPYANTDA